jgi:hypothetical protein
VRRSLLALLTLIALVPLAAACGSGDAPSAAGQTSEPAAPATMERDDAKTIALAEIARATRNVGTVRADFELTGIPASEGGDMTGKGVIDFDRGALDFEYLIAGKHVRVLFDGTQAYIRQPGVALPGGKSWVLVDAAAAGLDGGSVSDDPAELVRWLEIAGQDVSVVGDDRIRGAATTHVRATIDLEKAVELVPADEREAARKAFAQLGTMEMPTEVWVGDDDRIRRIAVVLSNSPEIALSMTFYGFGAAKVTAPPAADVFDPATAS